MRHQLYTMVILGPQGSGKGTQAEILARRFHLHHIDMGQLLRRFVRSRHPQAARVRQIMNEGRGLVPSSLVIQILHQAVRRIPASQGLLFDGFPRNGVQARALDRLLRQQHRTITHVFYLPISAATTVRRLALRHREDDTPTAIRRRLDTYRKQTKPIIAYYRTRGVLITVNGEPAIPIVTRSIMKYIASRS